MGNLDGRIEQEKGPAPEAAGGVKDGPTGMATQKAPSKDDGADQSADKASDVVHNGDADTGVVPSTR